ncbi:MAG: polymerase protein [Candidatus Roizmanbacteria bacterium GW2011_GWB1_40_7]|uniref:Polymerase protein n=2 Tax=Candidatus Roizmaniibacteriota TaxID=1752723 RepID=A0A0G0ZI60_9BACT|nr:MAG: polymerase protein [Candidatus Roizmanbacteria bacterium GW2011_GWB1_40_7]KKS21721.1 MAG: polymerase protein [Candidatus Roizmanbacteria bacterium GW2011_GWC2_41_7]
MTHSSDYPKKLLLIDGNAIMHRAYHALPALTNKDGQLTNAVYGFLSMLLSITDKLKPTHLIVCFDRPEPTFRKQMYVGYQAHRPKMEDGLSSQFALVKEAVSAMNIPIYEQAGFEADDVIGTLAWQATHLPSFPRKRESHKIPDQVGDDNTQELMNVVIVTGDRDILQLVNDTVYVYMPVSGLNNGKLYTSKEVVEKFGITPPQIVDYKALAGDASDNYPGVRGIGPKTASELLKKYGTVEGIYNTIRSKDPKILRSKEKTIKALSEYAEDAAMAKKLAKILHDVPVTIDIEKAKLHDFDTPEALEVLQKFGFASLVKRVMGVEESKDPKIQRIKDPNKKRKENNDSEQLSLV